MRTIRRIISLLEDLDFSQPPRPPLILPLHPAPGPASRR